MYTTEFLDIPALGAARGTVTLPGADPTAGSVSVQIDTSSLQSDNETLTGLELLEQFRTGTMKMAFVVDEYGDFQGIITLYDKVNGNSIVMDFLHPKSSVMVNWT